MINDKTVHAVSRFIFILPFSTNPILISGVATGGMRGFGPPTYVQTPPEINANPLKSIFYIWGVSHAYIYIL